MDWCLSVTCDIYTQTHTHTHTRTHTHSHTQRDPNGRFYVMPRLENGPIYPNGPWLTVNIPCFLTLYAYSGALQEGALHTMMVAPPNCAGVPEGWRIGFVFCRKQESKRGMSKDKADELMQDFFKNRRVERAEEQELLQDKLDGLRDGVDELGKNEYMSGNVLDSVNFLKQDASAPAPKTKSGTVTQAMLAKLTSPDQAELYEKKAEAAAKILGGLVHGALATMTGEAAAGNMIESVRTATPGRQRPVQDDAHHGNGAEHSKDPAPRRVRDGQRSMRGAAGGELGESVEALERERQTLMAKIHALEQENHQLKERKSQSARTPPPAPAGASSSFLPSFTPSTSLFSSWTTSKEGAAGKPAYTPKSARKPDNKPEWL
jgi:hypothetical protein